MASIDEEAFESKTEVEKIIVELKESNINFENYKNYVIKIQNTSKIISAQIESLIREYRAIKRKNEEKRQSKNFVRAEEEGFIPKEVYEIEKEMADILRDAYSWKSLEIQMHNLIFTKISQVLDDAKALDIKRDALKEMREMETKRNDLFLRIMTDNNKIVEDIVNNKLKTIDEKIMGSVTFTLKEAMADKKETLMLVLNIMRQLNMDTSEFSKQMSKTLKEQKEIDDELKKPIGVVKYEKTEIRDDKKTRKEKPLIDDDPFEKIEGDTNDFSDYLDDDESDDDDYKFKGD